MVEFRIEQHDEVVSTNALVKEALKDGAPEGLVVCARTQSGGYGRQGRAWSSPEGGLYCSLLLRPRVDMPQLPSLSLVVALATRRALASVLPDASRVSLKWPNDIVVVGGETPAPETGETPAPQNVTNDTSLCHIVTPQIPNFAKLCGISLEACGGGVCVGLGVNVARPQQAMNLSGAYAPAFLRDLGATVSPSQTLDAVLREFAPLYDLWQSDGLAPLLDELRAHAALTGKRVEIAAIDGTLLAEGIARDIDEQGCLLIETPAGVRALASGEAHVRW